MRSVRFRKLMQGVEGLQTQKHLSYEVTVSPGVTCECELESWREEEIRQLQQSPPYKALLLEFSESVAFPEQVLGKKSPEILASKSNNLCIKNITADDLRTLEELFKMYWEVKRNEGDIILVPILAVVVLHSLHANNHCWKDPFIVMPNLKLPGCFLYDLKGHTDNRYIPSRDSREFSFGKDQNFLKSQHRKLLRQAPESFKKNMLSIVEKNTLFFRKNKIIDYSLLLIFRQGKGEGKGWGWGKGPLWHELGQGWEVAFYIIDFLQVFTERKKLEHKVKSLFFKAVSSIDPDSFAERLLQFLSNSIF